MFRSVSARSDIGIDEMFYKAGRRFICKGQNQNSSNEVEDNPHNRSKINLNDKEIFQLPPKHPKKKCKC